MPSTGLGRHAAGLRGRLPDGGVGATLGRLAADLAEGLCGRLAQGSIGIPHQPLQRVDGGGVAGFDERVHGHPAHARFRASGLLAPAWRRSRERDGSRPTTPFMEESKKENRPFFLWWNSTRMHIWTHLKAASQGKTGLGVYPDGMVEHDAMVGQLLDKLEELGLEENTIVMYSTDNGAEKFTWPDGGQSPFRGEKATNWEGGYRVPAAIRWPGVIEPGTVLNDVFAHEDMLPTLLAAAGEPDVKGKLLKGMKGRQQDLQGAPGRLRHHRRACGQVAEPASRVLLFQ